jgi:heme/copper-type cytochrome/quinol oxidase subunit 1
VAEWGTWVAIASVLALVAGLLYAWPSVVTASLIGIGGIYAAQLAIDDEPLDLAVVFVGAGVLVLLELAHWSLEERHRVRTIPGEAWRRLAFLCALGAAAIGASATLVALVDLVSARGLAIDLLGTLAAATAIVAVVVLARRGGGRSSEERR